jgi:hypothetical protein
MKTLWQEESRNELTSRLGRLSAESRPLWGKMNAPQMLAHLNNSLRMAKGELKAAPKNLPIRYPPLKQLIVYWLPFPKGSPTAPELINREPGDWALENAELCRHLVHFSTRSQTEKFPDHPAFGRMTPRAWGVLVYRHIDHHFRQFGV